MSLFFKNIEKAPKDPIFGLKAAFTEDTRKEKVDLCVGIFKTDELKSPTMQCVQKASQMAIEIEKVGNYLPFDGDPEFTDLAARLVFGHDFYKKYNPRLYKAQALGGTGALRVLADFIKKEVSSTIYVPDPTWANHVPIFEKAFLDVQTYDYFCKESKRFDFDKMYRALSHIPEKSVVLFHASCHNPSGSDPTLNEWNKLLELCLKKGFLPLFDIAYQGFGDGVEEDVQSVRLFLDKIEEMLVVTTFSKNFSLYQQRVGALFVLGNASPENAGSQIKRLIRTNYSNPPSHGANIVKLILKDQNLTQLWHEELKQMRSRITKMREELLMRLLKVEAHPDYQNMLQHKGMFSFCNLSKDQVNRLISDFGIYMPANGRINVAGLNESNMDFVVHALKVVGS